MKTYKYLISFSVLLAFLLAGCESLDVKNENDPDFATAFSTPGDVRGVAGSFLNTWFMAEHSYDGPALALAVASDALTCSYGNRGMRDFSYEPRIVFNNASSYGDAILSEGYYKGMGSLLSYANDVLKKVVVDGMVVKADNGTDETPMIKAISYFAQGVALGNLGLLYDKGYVVTETTDVLKPIEQVKYGDMITAALASLDKAIEICGTSTFTLPSDWFSGTSMTNVMLGQLANTMAARFLAYAPRNKAEDAAVNWTKVESYANKGITFDFAPVMDDVKWFSDFTYYGLGTWGYTDMRIVNLMDTRFPARWPGANGFSVIPAPITAPTAGIDNRILTDFQFKSSCPFYADRGYYHFSCYRYKRRDTYVSTFLGPVPLILKAENDLLKAEALLHKPDLTGAAAIINAGARITRGNLGTVAANAASVEAAIFHERNIELFGTSMGLQFFVMRKADKLQKGTPLHLPIPGQQLDVNLIPYYTFGDTEGEPGKDVSNGGWF